MQYQRFVISPEQQQGTTIELTQAQNHYLRRVLRLNVGDRAIAMTGQGTAWIVELTPAQADMITPIAIETELPVNITLMVALPKQGIDEIIRCCTEIGVTTIVPLLSERTLLKPSANKLTRWQRIAQEAAEQSERAIVPTIREPTPFASALKAEKAVASHCYLCTARSDAPLLSTVLSGQLTDSDSLVIVTGCEGGWTDSELSEAQASGFQWVSLGRRILRAVTAPIVACGLVASASESLETQH